MGVIGILNERKERLAILEIRNAVKRLQDNASNTPQFDYNKAIMQDARIKGRKVKAGPKAPKVAQCPACGGEVHLRKRRLMGGGYTYYYRHKQGTASTCPRRYNPL